MTMTFNQAGDAVPVNDDGVSDIQDDYTRIGEMAKMFNVTLRTLRFYEDKGLLSPKRDGSTRLYTRRDRARLKLILLGRKVGFSLRDVKQIDLHVFSRNPQAHLLIDLPCSDSGAPEFIPLHVRHKLRSGLRADLQSELSG